MASFQAEISLSRISLMQRNQFSYRNEVFFGSIYRYFVQKTIKTLTLILINTTNLEIKNIKKKANPKPEVTLR